MANNNIKYCGYFYAAKRSSSHFSPYSLHAWILMMYSVKHQPVWVLGWIGLTIKSCITPTYASCWYVVTV